MTVAFYNDIDAHAARTLRNLMAQGVLPSGTVSQASILDLTPDDLRLHRQAHFFAGIGGWPFALQLAGYGDLPCWTGSPPCQPFSVAGRQRGVDDERHLAPAWINLIRECRPPVIFGEQVADAIRHGWLDDLFDALEAEGYTCGAAVLPACSVGAPHIRKRLFFGAVRVGHSPDLSGRQCDLGSMGGAERPLSGKTRSRHGNASGTSGCVDGLGNAPCIGREVRINTDTKRYGSGPHKTGGIGGLAYPHNARPQGWAGMSERANEQPSWPRGVESGSANSHHGFWSNADWLGCRDGKFRPVEPGSQPLVDGLPGRVGRLCGYGNAIVPQLAAVFITAFIDFVLSFNSRKE